MVFINANTFFYSACGQNLKERKYFALLFLFLILKLCEIKHIFATPIEMKNNFCHFEYKIVAVKCYILIIFYVVQIENSLLRLCLEMQLHKDVKTLNTDECDNMFGDQAFAYQKNKQIMAEAELCLGVQTVSQNNNQMKKVILENCLPNRSNQQWELDEVVYYFFYRLQLVFNFNMLFVFTFQEYRD